MGRRTREVLSRLAVTALAAASGLGAYVVASAAAADTVVHEQGGAARVLEVTGPAAVPSSVAAPEVVPPEVVPPEVVPVAGPWGSTLAGSALAGSAAALESPIPLDDGRPAPATDPDRLVLVGDSLAQEIFPILQELTPGMALVPRFWGGTAPCDWRDTDLQADPRSVVVITFTGNSLTECMRGPDGVHLSDEALVERYRADVGLLVDRARAAGSHVVLVGQPHRAASFEAEVEIDGINAVYADYAARLPYVSFVDAGRAVETPDGRFASRLPCTDLDEVCDPDGTVVVRGDGVHFCPIVGENPCPVRSSGAVRFAIVIAGGVADPMAFD